jgi:recombination protein RecA
VTEIDALIDKVNRRMKADVLTYANKLQTFQRVTTGSLSFDLMLGGGWPLNAWNEIIGNESSGKTAITLKTIAANQALDPNWRCLWVASEDFNGLWASALGVDTGRVVLALTNTMEDAYTIIIEALDSQAFDAVVLDSYPALTPKSEVEAAMGDWTVGLGARLTNKLMRLSPPAQRREPGERNCLAIIVNQWRDKIGVMYGDPRTTPGGKGKNFSYLTRVEVSRDEFLTSPSKAKVGQTIKARTLKNKTAPPNRVAVTDFYFDDCPPFRQGQYDTVGEICNIAIAYEIITRKGAWYYYGEDRWNGSAAVLEALREDFDVQQSVDAQVRHRVLGTPLPASRRRVIKR